MGVVWRYRTYSGAASGDDDDDDQEPLHATTITTAQYKASEYVISSMSSSVLTLSVNFLTKRVHQNLMPHLNCAQFILNHTHDV